MVKQYFQAEGANIAYEVEGTGPCILFVPGGNGDCRIFKKIRNLLTGHFTVVIYDRRGFSYSKIIGPQNYDKLIDTDVEDIYNLMKSITNKQFVLFSNSLGGIIASKYLIRYPETVSKVFLHEPMFDLSSLSRGDIIRKKHEDIYNVYETEDENEGSKAVARYYFNDLDYSFYERNPTEEVIRNRVFYFKYVFFQYLFGKVNMDMVRAYNDKLVLLKGVESVGFFCSEPVNSFAKILRNEVWMVPGGHIGFHTEADMFLNDFMKIYREHTLIKSKPKL
ncbi:hypothetical protein INT48_008346 [Thamnidium elegans]|uniref:AB hydrolase-1 domain-containing protein n=1 Tax=Thamnidium elegans TaxID=101142 RepID=A0A8H7W2Q2_9FUNG|nr:hypothetical protein INT48_008346 [Thamnidium elegans]